MTIDHEIRQSHWKSPIQKVLVNILFTSRFLEDRTAKLLKPHGLTTQQFNILRILRGRQGQPATVKLLTERMLDKSSNASRLVDKLLEKKLVRRETDPDDRRAVEIRIEPDGLDLLEKLDHQLETLEKASNPSNFSDQEAAELSRLLDLFRNSLREPPSPLS